MYFKASRLLSLAVLLPVVLLCGIGFAQQLAPTRPVVSTWKLGQPVTTYWAGPPLTDAVAEQMAKGGWNLVWCTEGTLDVAWRHGLRAHLTSPLLKPASLDDEKSRQALEAFINRVKDHPALYSYQLKGELSVAKLPDWARLARFVRERDPRHALNFNLYPTYATNRQLGTSGGEVPAYEAYVRKFIEIIRPELLSYAHYNFFRNGDRDEYFLNLELIRQAAVRSGLPFINIVQASAWSGRYRIPDGNQLRWLVNTSLAYGAQGISYFVYRPPERKYSGGITAVDGTPTSLYWAASTLNREFVAIASQLQGRESLGAFHAGMLPPGTSALPDQVPVWPDPAVERMTFRSGSPAGGFVLGYFGATTSAKVADASHVMVVNLDYKRSRSIRLVARGPLSVFDAASRTWTRVGSNHVELRLLPGGGRLLRVDP